MWNGIKVKYAWLCQRTLATKYNIQCIMSRMEFAFPQQWPMSISIKSRPTNNGKIWKILSLRSQIKQQLKAKRCWATSKLKDQFTLAQTTIALILLWQHRPFSLCNRIKLVPLYRRNFSRWFCCSVSSFSFRKTRCLCLGSSGFFIFVLSNCNVVIFFRYHVSCWCEANLLHQ